MYLGEVVWRISCAPRALVENTRDERFWFRTYGVLTAFFFLLFVLALLMTAGDQILEFVRQYDLAIGTERVVLQTAFYLVLGLMVGVPLLVVSLLIVAVLVGLVALLLGLMLSGVRYVRKLVMARGIRTSHKKQGVRTRRVNRRRPISRMW